MQPAEPKAAVQLVAGGRGGKERAARHERSSDWPRGAQPPDPEHVTIIKPYGSPDPDRQKTVTYVVLLRGFKKRANESFRIEFREIAKLFACTDEQHWDLELVDDGEDDAAFGGTV